ncbi:MAG TPA: transglutaminase domain-containing protein [Bacteroidales bacterium]|nr:transglutaminase domain-containing protein [Bacteroidales bacterium]HRZ20584.1 transglutaminase domain-containing protein [Bacteroidales bacterium]
MKKWIPYLLMLFILFHAAPVAMGYPGEVIRSFSSPGEFPTGLAFDGNYLWVADRYVDKIFCIDPANGVVIRSIPSPGYWPAGLAWDGQYLWNIDFQGGLPLSENYNAQIYQLDPVTGNILHTVQSPAGITHGLAWDGGYLWCTDSDAEEIIQFSPRDGTTIRSFSSPSVDPRGITYDGNYLWVADRITNEIYMMDPVTGSVLLITSTPGEFAMDMCFDGNSLWIADDQDNKIYELKARDDERFIRYNERHAIVTFRHVTTNFGPGKVLTSDVHLAVPEKRDSQDIMGEIRFSPAPDEYITDRWGQRTALYHTEDIQAGEQVEVQMVTEVKTYAVRYFIFPDRVGSLSDIPESISSKYLEDNEKYQIHHPVIRQALEEAISDQDNVYWIVRHIYNYINDHMYYEMTGGWNTAPTVLSRGNGSCSEYTFVFISMCRAAGVPARYVGSVVVRGDDTSMDDVFHRWVEVYLPNFGWIPVDPSGGDSDSPRGQAMGIGNLSNRFLITTQSGGGSETMEWTYNSNEFRTTEPKTHVVSEHFGDWEKVK